MKNAVNLATNLVGFLVTFGISFFLSPYIVRTLGVEANGLIGLTSNFSLYASVLTVLLSSMAARFITLELRSGAQQAANDFYTAAYASNLIGAAVLIPLMILTVLRFGDWFNVPTHLVLDAQLLATLYFLSFLLPLLVPRWSVGTWATNNLYLDSLRTMQSVLIRGGLILALFTFFRPAAFLVGIAALGAGIFTLAFSGYYKHRLLPNLRISLRRLQWARMLSLWTAGFWNSVNYLGSILSTGFHLLLAATLLGATTTGLLSLAMAVPAMAYQMALNLAAVFMPSLAFSYSAGDLEAMRRQAQRAVSITSLITMLPFASLIVFGEEFFQLWVPGESAERLYQTSLAAASALILAAIFQPLQNVFVITNSQRAHAVASLGIGAANVGLAVVLLVTTELGVFAILLAALLTTAIRTVFVTGPMAARRVRGTAGVFFPEAARGLGYLAIAVMVGLAVQMIHQPSTWLGLVVSVGLMCTLGTLLSVMLLVAPGDRQMAFSVARKLWPGRP